MLGIVVSEVHARLSLRFKGQPAVSAILMHPRVAPEHAGVQDARSATAKRLVWRHAGALANARAIPEVRLVACRISPNFRVRCIRVLLLWQNVRTVLLRSSEPLSTARVATRLPVISWHRVMISDDVGGDFVLGVAYCSEAAFTISASCDQPMRDSLQTARFFVRLVCRVRNLSPQTVK